MVIMTTTTANILTGLAFALAIAFLIYRRKAKMQKTSFIAVLLMSLMGITALSLVYLSQLSYLLWIPLLAVSISAFLKKRATAYKAALTISAAITLLLWVPPIYLLSFLF